MRVNEIFYSLQGEGRYTGTAAVFIRLAGCNMRCDFCDTRHETYIELSEDEIVRQAASYPARHVVVTGGEPTLQLTSSLVDKLHEAGKFVQIETNGTIALSPDLLPKIDWITCSPKIFPVKIQHIDEVKVVYRGQDITRYEALAEACGAMRSLQPCDENDPEKNALNLAAAIEYIKAHPAWRLSLQTHKIMNIR